MSKPILLAEACHVIIKRMVESGQAPFYTWLARDLGLSVEEGQKHLARSFLPGNRVMVESPNRPFC
jgi:hypothetical protein